MLRTHQRLQRRQLCAARSPGKAGFLLAAGLRQPRATGEAESPKPALTKSRPPARAQLWGAESPLPPSLSCRQLAFSEVGVLVT